MLLTMIKSKIHRATVTEANLHYVGSMTIDEDLLKESGILEYEKVQVVNLTNGNRLETYAIKGKAGSGVICANGAAAWLINSGDIVIIMAYCHMDSIEAKSHRPTVVFVDSRNKICSVKDCEEASEIF